MKRSPIQDQISDRVWRQVHHLVWLEIADLVQNNRQIWLRIDLQVWV